MGTITSNGHNVFGSDVVGNVAGDLENAIASSFRQHRSQHGAAWSTPTASSRCATASPTPPSAAGSPSMRWAPTSWAMPARSPPASSPDIGAAELNQTLSTHASANNDVLTGTSAANTISGGLGNDRIVGLAGNDTLNGNDGSDTFDGGTGNDKINGGTGVDIALYSGSTALVFDLSGTTDKVTQGSAVDTLTGIEGGSGSSRRRHLQGRRGQQLLPRRRRQGHGHRRRRPRHLLLHQRPEQPGHAPGGT